MYTDEKIEELLYIFNKIIAIYHLLLLEKTKAYQLTFSHTRVIHQLKMKEPRTSAEISEKLEISASSLSGMLDRLEQMGLILRERDKKDRRLIWIRLSEKSKKIIGEISESLTKRMGLHLEKINLTAEDIDVLIEKMNQLVESFHLPSNRERGPEA